jgi:histidinol dehydrogenase
MIRRVDLRGAAAAYPDYRRLVPRAEFDVDAALEVVRPICEDIKERGVAAVLEYSAQFDGVDQTDIAVPREALARALAELDPDVRAGLEESIRRLRTTCEAELERDVVTDLGPGARVTQRMIPVDRVGLYVPGGVAPLVSSVVMNVVPAQVAGVGSIALSSSPQRAVPNDWGKGLPHPTILAACELLGIEEVYAVGGAQAIAMLAYGAGPCRPVDLVTGPGNIYTVSAKRFLKGVVGIDSEAGPTEIAILADDTADAAFVAADLISQAEHDPMAASVLVTDSVPLADEVERELDKQVSATKHVERIRTALAGQQSGIVLVDDVEQGLEVVNAYAAEHLEIHTADAAAVAARVRNAGAVFVGGFAPVSLGDYCAGSNHVLPTAGCACHSSGLSVRAFLRAVHVIEYSRDALLEVADHVTTLADAEDLPGHGAAVRARLQPDAEPFETVAARPPQEPPGRDR